MGGIGSGSGRTRSWTATTDDYRSIDVRRWKREGWLAPHQSFDCTWSRQGEVVSSIRVRTEPDRVILTDRYRSGGEDRKDKSYPVYLDWTDCNLVGKRPWFLCPVRGCGRRVAILYGGGIFACRHCYQLAYPSQRETGYNRMARRANRIHSKLGWGPVCLSRDGGKPKGMHWNTFKRLTAQHDAFVQTSLARIAVRLPLPW